MIKTLYFQHKFHPRTIVAIRKYADGHYHANVWIKGHKMTDSNRRIPAALLGEMRTYGKLVGVTVK